MTIRKIAYHQLVFEIPKIFKINGIFKSLVNIGKGSFFGNSLVRKVSEMMGREVKRSSQHQDFTLSWHNSYACLKIKITGGWAKSKHWLGPP